MKSKLVLLLSLLSLSSFTQTVTVLWCTNFAPISCINVSGCPGKRCSYSTPPDTNGNWGFAPVAGQSTYSFTDTNHTDTKVQCIGNLGHDDNCDVHTVFVASPPQDSFYRVTVYFPTKAEVPPAGTHYPLIATNFVQ